ncbi:unnamed protein product [Acanthoscelides obtectus]|nr:unnamed protein product [Acanthoscelides obtectus]CAK1628848.1 hypothetical protein AOBTE_LOCUS5431 [Acanthoscelides obtectus]
MKFADFDGYQENEDQLIPDNIEETENQSKNVEYFEMSSSQERENDTDDDTRNDTREEATYSPDFRERENSFEHHGSFKHKHLEVLTERHPRVGRIKPLPSAHFSGDTSRYILGQHPNFNGNGHLKHLQRMFMDWKPSEWAHHTGLDSHFQSTIWTSTT